MANKAAAAAAIAGCATFGVGTLTALNASQKKAQSASAGAAYRELEVAARQLRYLELPFVPLGDALARCEAISESRMSINRIAEPPTTGHSERLTKNQKNVNSLVGF